MMIMVTDYFFYQCIHDYNIYHTTTATTTTVRLLLEIMNVYHVITIKDNIIDSSSLYS